MKIQNLQAVVWKEGKFYVSQCIQFDISSFGKTKKEALESLKDAVSLYLKDTPTKKKFVSSFVSFSVQNA